MSTGRIALRYFAMDSLGVLSRQGTYFCSFKKELDH